MRSAIAKAIAAAVLTACLLSACGQNRRDYLMRAEPDEVSMKINSNYSAQALTADQTHLEQPTGIACRKDDILVCDQKKNAIVRLGLDGAYLGKIGKLGMGPGEFNHPTGITVAGDKVYVIDAFNHRIQEFNNDLKYIQSYTLPDTGNGNVTYFIDIAVSPDGSIYASANTLRADEPKLCLLQPDSPAETVSKDFFGMLNCDGAHVWALNSMELYSVKDIDGAAPGDTELFQVEGQSMTEAAKLPFGYNPVDFIVSGSQMDCLSLSWSRLDRFDLNGNYQETLAQFDEDKIQVQYLDMDSQGQFWVTGQGASDLYRISPKSPDQP